MERKKQIGRIGSLLLIGLISFVTCDEDVDVLPVGKQLSFFNVVKFPNIHCTGSSNRNGTCYTSEECENRDGVASGSCADGFGVCCIITLSCGETSAENNTYFEQESTTSPSTSPCRYKICPVSKSICRIKFDLTTFEIASPMRGDMSATTAQTTGGSVGDCSRDSFSVSSGGASFRGSPVICGTNTGQHMIVDTDGTGCVTASFVFGGGSDSRQYDVRVLQYDCTNSDVGGPPGCLQYFTANQGTVASFNYPLGQTTVDTTTTGSDPHLSNQDYEMCWRRSSDKCALCFFPTLSTTTPASFGVGVGTTATAPATPAANAMTGTSCTTDFLQIPGGTTSAIALALRSTTGATTTLAAVFNRFCGRFFSITSTGTSHVTICTGVVPFRIRFITNEDESTTGTTSNTNELVNNPEGTIGFSLTYVQTDCT